MRLSKHDVAEMDGGCTPLKVLMSGACLHDCGYCPNSTSASAGSTHRESPEDVVDGFLEMRRRGFSGGLFLSSGVEGDAGSTQELLVETAELARSRRYGGYLHLKVMPGAPRHLIERGAEVADRMSVNVETLPGRMGELSSTKDRLIDVERRLRWVSEADVPSGATTQLIAGGARESDEELLREATRLYDRYGLRRVYYSGFRPIRGTAMEGREAAPPGREVRLYRADWLYREYGYGWDEVSTAFDDGSLPEDPKVAIAERTGLEVDPDDAGFEELIRVPGVGPERARGILDGVDVDLPRRARPYVGGQSRLRDFG